DGSAGPDHPRVHWDDTDPLRPALTNGANIRRQDIYPLVGNISYKSEKRPHHEPRRGCFWPGTPRGVSAQPVREIRLIVAHHDLAREPATMNSPGRRFDALSGDRRGQYAVSVSGNWRIAFELEGETATNVDLVD